MQIFGPFLPFVPQRRLFLPKACASQAAGKSDKAIVAEVEERAAELAGPYLSKEHDSFALCCPSGSRVNRSFAVMGVKYPNREEPKKL